VHVRGGIIQVVEYDPAWPLEFEAEAARIVQAAGDMVLRLHHIGSTAIPGIPAKPIIDFLMEVEDLSALDTRTPAIESLGYEAMGEFGIPGRRYFRKNNASGIRTHQVHAFDRSSAEIERHLAFRDYMIAHPVEANSYGELKRQLAKEHPTNMDAYMDGKDPFIKSTLAKAIDWRRSQEP
jgi:GrpB-like predicted nucleotidyltransferase (UPF0157 family)